jgi:hypothetical protein
MGRFHGHDIQALEDDMKLSHITALTTVAAAVLALAAVAATPMFAQMMDEKTVTVGTKDIFFI